MKKLLLLMATILVAGTANAQEWEDITPSGYDFSTMEVGPYVPQAFFHGANHADKANNKVPVPTIAEQYYDNGLFFVSGGQYLNPDQPYAANLQAGLAIVDLGGEVGKVMALSGKNSKINETLEELFGVKTNIPLCSGEVNWFNMDWTSDPKNTPTMDKDNMEKNYNIRARIVFNVFANEPNEAINLVNTVYTQDAEDNVRPKGQQNAANTNITCAATTKDPELDDDGDPISDVLEWDPTKWIVMEWFSNCAQTTESGTWIPTRIKMEMNGGAVNNTTLFIKEIKFFGTSTNIVSDITPVKTAVTYTPELASGVAGIGATARGAEKMYNLNGMEVTPSATAKGIYIEKRGNKTVKVIR